MIKIYPQCSIQASSSANFLFYRLLVFKPLFQVSPFITPFLVMKNKQEKEPSQLRKCAVERFIKKTIHEEGMSLRDATIQAYEYCHSFKHAFLNGYKEAVEIMEKRQQANQVLDLSAIQPLDQSIERLLQVVNEDSLVFSPEKKQESGGENLVMEQEEISLKLSGPADQLVQPIQQFEGKNYSKVKIIRSDQRPNLHLKGSQIRKSWISLTRPKPHSTSRAKRDSFMRRLEEMYDGPK